MKVQEIEKKQHLFILEVLNRHFPCELKDRYIDKLSDISTSKINIILNQKFASGADMKALFCLFDTMFLSSFSRRQEGLVVLKKDFRKFIRKIELVANAGANGNIYMTQFFLDTQFVIKFPNYYANINTTVREYFIGIKSINNLRYLVPTFVYTLGSFMCPGINEIDKTEKQIDVFCNTSNGVRPFILYEKIPDDSITTLFKKDELNFQKWLVIFFQLLLGLEVAQKEVRFTHFDMHTENVLVRKKDNYNYKVNLDMFTYSVNNPHFIPAVIDFGGSTSYIEGEYIGNYEYIYLGMMNFMIPGYDMYKFIIWSIYESNEQLKKEIQDVLRFYSKDDPYSVLSKDFVNINEILKVFCKDVTFGRAANYTPHMFMKWLLKEYPSVLNPYITEKPRATFQNLNYSSMLKEYNNIFNYTENGVDDAINKCINTSPSYIMSKYMIFILERYNKNLDSKLISSKIKQFKKYLVMSQDTLIQADIDMMETIFHHPVPDEKDLKKCINNILSINIPEDGEPLLLPLLKKETEILEKLLEYQDNLSSYLQFYFTILELELEDIFGDWIEKFRESDIYRFHINNSIQNERAQRWSYSLIASATTACTEF